MVKKGKLYGKTILNIRPLEKALPLARAIEQEGGKCIVLPSMEIIPIASLQALPEIEKSDAWIFVSQYAVKYAFGENQSPLRARLKKGGSNVIAIGQATAEALQEANIPIDILPKEFSSEGLLALQAFQSLPGKTITIFRGKNGRTLLDEILKERGADVNEVILYERVIPSWTQKDYQLLDAAVDLALGLSRDSLTYFFSQLQLHHAQRFFNVPWLVMSHRIAEEAERLGIKTIYSVSDGNVFESLIRCCCSPDR